VLEITESVILRETESTLGRLLELKALGLSLAVDDNRDGVAEGIQRSEQVEGLRFLGCEFGQGYFFARPLTAAEFGQLLVRPSWSGVYASLVSNERVAV
jgi:EAL domain-containing protein (putative c-di-GMP-specific phosphodiesterase class I)